MMISNIFPFHLKQNKSLDAVVENLQFTYFSKYGYFFPFTGEDNSQVKKIKKIPCFLSVWHQKNCVHFVMFFLLLTFLRLCCIPTRLFLKFVVVTVKQTFSENLFFGINFTTKQRKSKRNIQAFSQIINLFLCILEAASSFRKRGNVREEIIIHLVIVLIRVGD